MFYVDVSEYREVLLFDLKWIKMLKKDSNMAPRLSGQNCKFKFLLSQFPKETWIQGIQRQI